ncbi:MAG: GntR family transcriptional regulator [Verrucomicrobiae bacterium]|nr:GntR family transcriptional regulator [Verrucomicrobiae bacterium]
MINNQLDMAIQPREPVHVQIERFLRQQIQSGKLPPGEHLPSTRVLAQHWHTDCTAIQKAMTRLVAEGLIDRRANRGTFVRESSQRDVIAFFIGPDLADETAHFYRCLYRCLCSEMGAKQETRWTFRVYDGLRELNQSVRPKDSLIFQRLAEEYRNSSFRGVIEIDGTCKGFADSKTEAALPRARMYEDVALDMHHFGYSAMELMKSKGIQRTLYLRTKRWPQKNAPEIAGMEEAARALSCPPPHIYQMSRVFGGSNVEQMSYRQMLSLIDDWEKKGKWPEALILDDDIAARGVSLALAQKQVNVPDRLLVACMTNKEIVHQYGIPIMRYQISVQTVAQALLNVLTKRLTGDPLPALPIKISGDGWVINESDCYFANQLTVQKGTEALGHSGH